MSRTEMQIQLRFTVKSSEIYRLLHLMYMWSQSNINREISVFAA